MGAKFCIRQTNKRTHKIYYKIIVGLLQDQEINLWFITLHHRIKKRWLELQSWSRRYCGANKKHSYQRSNIFESLPWLLSTIFSGFFLFIKRISTYGKYSHTYVRVLRGVSRDNWMIGPNGGTGLCFGNILKLIFSKLGPRFKFLEQHILTRCHHLIDRLLSFSGPHAWSRPIYIWRSNKV